MDFEDAQFFIRLAVQFIRNMPREPVVGSQRVANADDQNARHGPLVSHDLVDHRAVWTE